MLCWKALSQVELYCQCIQSSKGCCAGTVLKLGTQRHHDAMLHRIDSLSATGCFALTELALVSPACPPGIAVIRCFCLTELLHSTCLHDSTNIGSRSHKLLLLSACLSMSFDNVAQLAPVGSKLVHVPFVLS